MREAFLKRLVNPAAGRPKSLSWKLKAAERAREGRSGHFTSKRAPYTRSDGRVIRCRSVWEYLTAEYLDRRGTPWEYEPRSLTRGAEVYLPDFWTQEEGYVEVKGYFPSNQREKLARFQEVYAI